MSEHTPGPWHVASTGPEGPRRVWTQWHDLIATVACFESPRNDSVAGANARLIAAAPEMLEALLEAESYMASQLTPDEPPLIAVRAAIRKAIGEP